MLEKYIPKRFATAMIKHVIAVTLFFPYIYSHNNNPAYADFMLVNVFVILAMVFICTSWKLDFKRNGIFVGILGVLLLAYNGFATYMNVKYHHWYGDQFNTTLAFLFFMLLLLVKDSHALIDTATIKATIHMIVASNVLAIGCWKILEYTRIIFMNNWVEMKDKWWYTHFSWLYGHKSEYAFLLVLCIAFCTLSRKYFYNNVTYILSQCVLIYALYLSNVYTSMVAVLLILGSQFLDFMFKAKWWQKLISAVIIIPIFLCSTKLLFSKISASRELLTLGHRIPIWKQFLFYIKENPNGIMEEYSTVKYPVEGIEGFLTNNCHNVFLNHMFRFSIPVGGLFTACILFIVFFSMKNKPTLTSLFIWIAFFIPLNMDQSLNAVSFPYFLTILYMIFFLKKQNQQP